MKKLILPDFTNVPPVPEQQALKKQIDARKTEILQTLLEDFLFYLNEKGKINNHDFVYEKEAKKFLKKVGQK